MNKSCWRVAESSLPVTTNLPMLRATRCIVPLRAHGALTFCAQRMRRERATSDWDIDRLEGGRADVELVISTLIYKHASAHPFVQDTPPGEALGAMARSGLISEETAQGLASARAFWARLQLVRSLGQWSDPLRAPVRRRFGGLIARAAGVQKFEQVRPMMRGYADEVSRSYAQIVLGRPCVNTASAASN